MDRPTYWPDACCCFFRVHLRLGRRGLVHVRHIERHRGCPGPGHCHPRTPPSGCNSRREGWHCHCGTRAPPVRKGAPGEDQMRKREPNRRRTKPDGQGEDHSVHLSRNDEGCWGVPEGLPCSDHGRAARRRDRLRHPSMDYNRVANQVVEPAPVFPESNHQEADEEESAPKASAPGSGRASGPTRPRSRPVSGHAGQERVCRARPPESRPGPREPL